MAPKRKHEQIKSEHESSSEVETKKPKATKGVQGRKAGGPSWTPEEDALLGELLRQQGEKKQWKTVEETFNEKFPNAGKTLNALKCRYRFVLKDMRVELTDAEKMAFKKAVEDVDTKRIRGETIAWRFSQLSKESKAINKSAVTKLEKAMKTWTIGTEDSTKVSNDEDGIYDEENDPEDEKPAANGKANVAANGYDDDDTD